MKGRGAQGCVQNTFPGFRSLMCGDPVRRVPLLLQQGEPRPFNVSSPAGSLALCPVSKRHESTSVVG